MSDLSSWAGTEEKSKCAETKYKTEAHKQKELCTVIATAMQFGLKYFSVYGVRLDKNKITSKNTKTKNRKN